MAKFANKSGPAGLPSGFQSNVTVRNQFSKVHSRPTDTSPEDQQRYYIPRDNSRTSSNSPYGGTRQGPQQQLDRGEAPLRPHDVIKEQQNDKTYTKKGGFTPNAAFNRFASDKSLLAM